MKRGLAILFIFLFLTAFVSAGILDVLFGNSGGTDITTTNTQTVSSCFNATQDNTKYILNSDITASQLNRCINIEGRNNIIIDCQGHQIQGTEKVIKGQLRKYIKDNLTNPEQYLSPTTLQEEREDPYGFERFDIAINIRNSNNIKIQNCDIQTWVRGIYSENSQKLQLNSNSFSFIGSEAITLNKISNSVINQNILGNPRIEIGDVTTYSRIRKTLPSGMVIEVYNQTTIHTKYINKNIWYGIRIFNFNENILISENTINSNSESIKAERGTYSVSYGGAGDFQSQGNKINIINNILIGGINLLNGGQNKIDNNQLHGNSRIYTSFYNNTITNNIFYGNTDIFNYIRTVFDQTLFEDENLPLEETINESYTDSLISLNEESTAPNEIKGNNIITGNKNFNIGIPYGGISQRNFDYISILNSPHLHDIPLQNKEDAIKNACKNTIQDNTNEEGTDKEFYIEKNQYAKIRTALNDDTIAYYEEYYQNLAGYPIEILKEEIMEFDCSVEEDQLYYCVDSDDNVLNLTYDRALQYEVSKLKGKSTKSGVLVYSGQYLIGLLEDKPIAYNQINGTRDYGKYREAICSFKVTDELTGEGYYTAGAALVNCRKRDQTTSGLQENNASCLCQQSCGSRQCGPDPTCGISCGTCKEGEECQVGYCIQITANEGSEDNTLGEGRNSNTEEDQNQESISLFRSILQALNYLRRQLINPETAASQIKEWIKS
jgi:hypothetical protein